MIDRIARILLALVPLLAALLAGCAAKTPITLHPASAMVRIGGADGAAVPPAADTYRLQMVRNEREGFQFAVLRGAEAERPDASGACGVRLPPSYEIRMETAQKGAPEATLYQVLAINHAPPPTEGEFVVPPRRLGLVPDVLMPASHGLLRATPDGLPLTCYVEFRSTTDTRPGEYTYQIAVRGARTAKQRLRVRVSVADITLPDRLPFRTATTWNWTLEDYHGRPLTTEEKEVFWDFCLDQRLSPCSFFGKSPDPSPADLGPLKSRGLSVVSVLFAGSKKPKPFSAEFKQRMAPQLRQWREQLRAIGMENDAVILAADEPTPAAADVCRENAKWLKEQFPEVKIWIATRPSAGWSDFADVFDVVTAHSTDFYKSHSHTDEAMQSWRQSKPVPLGEYWWFHSVEPYGPCTNVRLDNLPIEARVSGWQSALYGVDGYEYFWITDWKANKESRETPWPQRAASWKTGMSGAGTLCYPDEQMRPMPSLRLINLRDGFEDWALLEMLTSRAAHADRDGRAQWISPVTRSLAEWSTDPQCILRARAEVISALQSKMKADQSKGAR